MRSLTLALLVCLSILVAVSACPAPKDNPNKEYATSSATKVFTESDSTITVNKGDEFAIVLNSNPTTGYTWMLKDDSVPAGLSVVGCRYKRRNHHGENQVHLVGTGGTDTWGFRAAESGSYTVELQKVRPWVKPRPDQMDATFTVNVQ